MNEEEKEKRRQGALRTYPGQTARRTRGMMKQNPWQSDPIILARMAEINRMWAEGKTEQYMLEHINAWCRSKGYPEVSARTIKTDKQHLLTVSKQDIEEVRQQSVNSLDHLKSVVYERMSKEDVGSNAAAQYASVIERVEADKAKITGAMVHRIDKQVTITEDETARVLVRVLAQRLGEEVAFAILEEVKREIDGKQEPKLIEGTVIDADSTELASGS